MPSDGYVALSFGGSQVETDMLVFLTDSFRNKQEMFDMWYTASGDAELD